MLRWLFRIFILLVVIYIAACAYFFNVAEIRNNHNNRDYTYEGLTPTSRPYVDDYQQRFSQSGRQLTIQNQGLTLDANYLPAARPTNKTVIVVHGFRNNKTGMKSYADMFYRLGYNTLTVDNRGHGQSQGNFVGFGWLDKNDVEAWIRYLVAQNKNVEIVPFGISMGGATVAMLSGDSLPANVRAIIEDSGYSSVEDEVAYQAKQMYHLPKDPIIPTVSLFSQYIAGYSYQEASTVKQLAKNTRPMLFMHGGADTYVPTRMVYSLYKADPDPRKQLWIGDGSGHVQAFGQHTAAYQAEVQKFLNLYFK
ncbi:MAG: alpha/beta hydrolase [Oenococcus sp.]|uniref:alpha/beta hydrolase n=1 Tax=Oenococcus TaxID=46254 RepID=UPI0021E93861|nr:alpha/beta hydrolase [Oenococcus kitaharae]MCV3296548.1 alpha/beta hydrolase [Oenococcus kitaharae]